jgi:acyl-CoA thioesterase FadM
LVDGEIRIACVDTPSLRPRRFPDEIQQHLA